jgi:integrase
MSERTRFTVKGIESIEPRAARFVVWDTQHPGLGLRVSPQGTKTYILAYRFDGKSRMHTIGNVAGIDLRDAFVAYADAMGKVERAKVARGHGETPAADLDPAGHKRRTKIASNAARTVEDVWKAFIKKKKPTLRAKTVGEYERMAKLYIVSELGAKKVRDVRPRDVKALLNTVEARGVAVANRTRALVAGIFAYAVDECDIEVNPAKSVRSIKGERRRERALEDEAELRGFFAALAHADCVEPIKRALMMTLATGSRPGESMGMRWSDIDDTAKTWTIPAAIAKTKRDHVVPLSAFAQQILADSTSAGALGDFVFPGPDGEEEMARSALSKALLASRSAFKEQGVTVFRPHDLRRTCRTWLAKLGIPELIAERVIGHVSKNKLIATYDRYQYLPEKRAALDLWGATLTAMRAGVNVVAIGSKAAA